MATIGEPWENEQDDTRLRPLVRPIGTELRGCGRSGAMRLK